MIHITYMFCNVDLPIWCTINNLFKKIDLFSRFQLHMKLQLQSTYVSAQKCLLHVHPKCKIPSKSAQSLKQPQLHTSFCLNKVFGSIHLNRTENRRSRTVAPDSKQCVPMNSWNDTHSSASYFQLNFAVRGWRVNSRLKRIFISSHQSKKHIIGYKSVIDLSRQILYFNFDEIEKAMSFFIYILKV
jgi:hypothetical protein